MRYSEGFETIPLGEHFAGREKELLGNKTYKRVTVSFAELIDEGFGDDIDAIKSRLINILDRYASSFGFVGDIILGFDGSISFVTEDDC